MPFIELFSLGNQLDSCLLQSIEAQGIMAQEDKPVAINLTHDSIQDPDFAKWLGSHINNSKYADKMFFELPESAVINDYEACQTLAHTIRDAGAKLGIDHCGRHMGSLEYLSTLHPHYIKLDPSYAFYEKQNLSNEMCRALVNVAKGLNIEVIITGIESEQLLEKFSSLRVEGYQGYIIPPQEIVVNI
jgi:EAL domain-containing protein (putative c-di-GMP-specific phosphodiesterase class I)